MWRFSVESLEAMKDLVSDAQLFSNEALIFRTNMFTWHKDPYLQKRRIRVTMLMIQDILIKAMISSFCKSMYLSYFRFQSNAWQGEGVIFFLSQVSQWIRCEFFLFIFCKKKKRVLLKSKSLSLKTIRALQRILTIFVKSKELSTASPNFRREQALAHSCFLMRRLLSGTNKST